MKNIQQITDMVLNFLLTLIFNTHVIEVDSSTWAIEKDLR